MTNLFNRAAIFCDIHLGKKNNDRLHNEDCIKFVKWFISNAKEYNADCIIFLGDFFDNRHAIQISTLDYSLTALDLLDDANLPIYFILGNHDLVHKEKRSLTSVTVARNYKNIQVINDITTLDGVTFCPWLVNDEWKQIQKLAKQSTYMFGHFEIPLFMMNAMVEMPDNGTLNYHHFDAVAEWAFSGHFHKKQSKGKVIYIGNAFPHNFSDVWDDDRGMMLLEWGKQPQFLNWPDAPSYRIFQISELLDNPETSLSENICARLNVDIDVTHNQVQIIRNIFFAQYSPRRLEIVNQKADDQFEFVDYQELKSVDQIVIEGLSNIDSVHMDKNILIQIYQDL